MVDQQFESRCRGLWSVAYQAAYRITGSREHSEDVAQRTVISAYNNWKTISGYDEPWVVRVATNMSINLTRNTGVFRRIAPKVWVSESVAPEADALVERLALREALAGLTERQRSVVILSHLYGFTMAETAEVLGISIGSAKTHAARGLASLRRALRGFSELDEMISGDETARSDAVVGSEADLDAGLGADTDTGG